jgi:hypothetical protein
MVATIASRALAHRQAMILRPTRSHPSYRQFNDASETDLGCDADGGAKYAQPEAKEERQNRHDHPPLVARLTRRMRMSPPRQSEKP